jgi:polyisoprenoid-binding protein YceI
MIPILAIASLLAAAPLQLAVVDSHVRIDGSSTLHAWSSSTTTVNARASVDADSLADAASGARPVQLELRVPVAALRSGESALDENLKKALHQKEHPFVVFALDGLTAESGKLRATGKLKISGEERQVTLLVTARCDGGSLRVEGSAELRMTDFKVEPPVLLFGAIKTADKVTVTFDVTWKVKQEKQS